MDLVHRMLFAGAVATLSFSFATAAVAQQTTPEPPTAPAQVQTAPPAPEPTPPATVRPAIKHRSPALAAEPRSSKRRKPAKAQRGTLTGARLVPFRSQAMRATVGFPDIELAYHFPYSPEIELIPRLQIAYGRNLSFDPNFMEAGTDVRKEFTRKGRWGVAWIGSAFIHLNLDDDDPVHRKVSGAYGIGLGCPGVVATYRLKPDIDVNFGVQVQNILYLDSNPTMELNIPFSIGFEVAMGKTVLLVQRTEFGPDIYIGERTDMQLRTYIGAGKFF